MTKIVLSAHVHRHNDDMFFNIYESPNGRFLCSWWLSSDIFNSHIRSYKTYAGALSYYRSTLETF